MQSSKPWQQSYHLGREPNLDLPVFPLFNLPHAATPDNVSLYYYGTKITYRELSILSDNFASSLQNLGIKVSDRVAISMPNIPQFVIALYGILKAGAVVVPCNPIYKEAELEHQLNDSGAKAIVFSDARKGVSTTNNIKKIKNRTELQTIITTDITDFLPDVKSKDDVISKSDINAIRTLEAIDMRDLMKKSKCLNPVKLNVKEDLALIQYTGGTTGISKGTMLTHYNLTSAARISSEWLQFTDKDILLLAIPLFDIYGVIVMNITLSQGGTIVLLNRFDPLEVIETIQRCGVTVFPTAPILLAKLLDRIRTKNYNLNSVRAFISGGSAAPLKLLNEFMLLTGSKIIEGYGMTETSGVTHINPLHDTEKIHFESIGVPIFNTDAKIVDIDDASINLPMGKVGELAVKGPQIMKGYWNQTAKTANTIVGDWFLTGDIAKMDQDGFFYLVDRKKNMINVGGFKVWPREVEVVLDQHHAIKESLVHGVLDENNIEKVHAIIVLRDQFQKTVSKSEIQKFCEEKISSFKVPKTIDFRNELPKTHAGKLLRRRT